MTTRTSTRTSTKAKATEEKIIEEPKVIEPAVEPKKERVFKQTDPILCRSVTPGWLGVSGKSGMYYTFENYGDVTEIEYGDLFALKGRHSSYLYEPLFVIEDEELLENPRWADIAEFYNDKVYGMDDIEYILNKPVPAFKPALEGLPKGLMKALLVEVAVRIDNGTFDSMKKIKIIDEVCGTDFWKMASES